MLRDIYHQRMHSKIFEKELKQDPPTLCSKQQEARGLHLVSALFFQKSAHHSKEFFKSAILKQHKIQRPSNSLFQIARGSGATLSECTFSSKKRTSPRRLLQDKTTSRTHDKKKPDRAISEFFFIKNPGTCSGTFQRRIRAI